MDGLSKTSVRMLGVMMQVAWFDRDQHRGALAWIVLTNVPLALQPLHMSP